MRLLTDATTGEGCNGGADLGWYAMGANVGATEVQVVAYPISFSPDCGGWLARLYQNSTPTISGATQLGSQAGPLDFTATGVGATQTVTFSGINVTQPFLIAWFNMNQPPCCGTWHITSVDDNFAGTYCATGVSLQTGASLVYYLTPGLIDTWLATVGMPWLAPFFTAFWFTTLNAESLCSALPPLTFQTMVADPSALSLTGLNDLLRAIAWQNVCQCNGGGISPPAPTQAEQPGTPSLPTTTCSNVDLCATVVDIWQDLAMTEKKVNEIYQLVLLIQRQSVPFAYLESTVHSSLTGTGFISVSGILGIKLSFTGGSTDVGQVEGTPITNFDAGWINFGDANGYRDRHRITTTPELIFPPAAGDITRVGYTLPPTVTATITELVREP